MASLIIFLIFYLSFVLPLHDSILINSQRVKKLSEIDEKLAEGSEILCSAINEALGLNQALEDLYLECASAQSPPQLAALQIKGKMIEGRQDFHLIKAHEKILEFKKDFEVIDHFPLRKAPGPCALPGALSCLGTQVFSLLRKNNNETGGSIGTSFQCKKIKWAFQDSRVKEL